MNGLKRLFWIVIILYILYIGYGFYTDWWGNTQDFSRTKEYVQNVFSKKGNEIKENVKDKTNEYVSTVVGEAKQSAFKYVKNKTSDIISSIGKNIINQTSKIFGVNPTETTSKDIIPKEGVFNGGNIETPQTQNFYAPPPPATISSNIGFPLVFSINSGISYIADWDDGTKYASSTIPDNATLLTHSWEKEGDYTVKITVKSSYGDKEYTFPVRIYK